MNRPLARLKRALARRLAGRPPPRTLDPATLPAAAAGDLRPDNPRLLELRARYAKADPRVTTPAAWTDDRLPPADMVYFRADNHFIWQLRGPNRNELTYALTYYHLIARGDDGLIDLLGEDGAFGAVTFAVDGRPVSRDLMDSVGEIQFLKRNTILGEGRGNVLDIGAGYGRLAWRLEQASGAQMRVFATDAFAPATFLAEYYLRHRGAKRAFAVPLDEVEALLAETKIDVAVNVHSFSECTADAVAWWAERLARHRVPQLMIVPNGGTTAGERCQIGSGEDMEAVLERVGYRIKLREPRYADPIVQKYGIDPVWLHLFELR
jgi:SAM-dependent methyltransferase